MADSNGSTVSNGNTKDGPSQMESEKSDNKLECGVGRCRPPAVRVLANMTAFSGVYGVSALLTSTLSSYVNSQVTTLERHFGFSSEQTGLILAANDVGFLTIVLFIGYIATRVHIPRFMGFATILFGISGILCALPQFVFGAPSVSGDVTLGNVSKSLSAGSPQTLVGQMCDAINTTKLSACSLPGTSANAAANSWNVQNRARANAGGALAIIVLGMVLQGVAKAPRHPLITTFVDNNIEKMKTGFYMGIIITFGIMGPAIAFALGGVFTKIYVTLEATDIGPRHPKWIGAWWLGYLAFGGAACLFSVPLFCFPRSFKRDNPEEKKSAKTKFHFIPVALSFVKGFLAAMFRLLKNAVFMTQLIASCFFFFAVAGGQGFTPKYIENQFSFPAWKANMSMAGMMLTTACLGTFLGGYISRRFKMGPLVSLKFTVVMQLVSSACNALMMVFTCDQPPLYNSPGPLAATDASLAGCFDGCTCDNSDYFPVCGSDGRTYFSPCHAGCLESSGNVYQNCTCIAGGTATAGVCDFSCPMFYPFMIFFAGQALFATFAIIPSLIVTIRCVEERDKGLALGFSSFMTSLTGWMLGPVLYGKLVDDICIQWDESCQGRGFCRLYDNSVFRWKLLGSQFAFRFLGFVFVAVGLVIAIVRKTFEKSASVDSKDILEMDTSVSLDSASQNTETSGKKFTWGS